MVVETPTSAFTRQKFYEDRILRPPMRNARKGDCASPEVEAKWDKQFPIPAHRQTPTFSLRPRARR